MILFQLTRTSWIVFWVTAENSPHERCEWQQWNKWNSENKVDYRQRTPNNNQRLSHFVDTISTLHPLRNAHLPICVSATCHAISTSFAGFLRRLDSQAFAFRLPVNRQNTCGSCDLCLSSLYINRTRYRASKFARNSYEGTIKQA